MKYVHQIPVMLSLVLSQKCPLSPNRSRKLMTLSCNNLPGLVRSAPFPQWVEGAGAHFQLHPRQCPVTAGQEELG